MKHTFKTTYKKSLVNNHNYYCKKHLYKSHSYMVILKYTWKRPAPHHMSHTEIHKYKQKYKRCHKSFGKLRCCCIFKRFLKSCYCLIAFTFTT